ncbi:MAG: hypothetical protein U9R13_03615 [Campylobacterota bacterium]|nr:hypothetical protein [Campylobacterota bacterium]
MNEIYGARDLVRNPSLLKIDPDDSFIVEDKKAHKRLGIYLGANLAQEFFDYKKREALLNSAKKIKENALKENMQLEGTVDDGL